MLKHTALFLLVTFSIFTACDNDIDVNADWTETAVIYGLLDAGRPTQFIRVQRTYQNGNADAIKVAQIGDSLFFDTLQVSLDVFNQNGNPAGTILLVPDQTTGKDTGMFATQPNTLYVTNAPINPNNSYRLVVTNPRSGKQYASATGIVRTGFVLGGLPALFFVPPTRTTSFTMITGTGAKAYDMLLQFHYMEYDSVSGDSTTHILEWVNASAEAATAKGNDELKFTITGSLMYSFIAGNISPKAGIYRRMKSCRIVYVGGSQELWDYISLSKPSIGIVQKKPEYSNIVNGLGIFSSRCTQADSLPVNDSFNYYLQHMPASKPLAFRSKL